MLDIFFFNDYWGFAIVLLNVYIYAVLSFILFYLFFSFKLSFFFGLNSLNRLNQSNFIFFNILFILLSFAGIPPLLGFISKFFLVTFIVSSSHIFFCLLILFFNFFVIYFYIQNFKFLVSNPQNHDTVLVRKIYQLDLNYHGYLHIVVLNFFNIFSFFFFNDIFFLFISKILF